MWFAKEHPDIPIVWISGRELSVMQKSILDVVEIKNKSIFLKQPTEFKKVIFPLPGLSVGDFVLKDHAKFLGNVKSSKIIHNKKIYMSRSLLQGERGAFVDEEKIDSLFQEYGFLIYHPQIHSLSEQLETISSSEIVVGVEGSALHSVLLLENASDTKFIAIGRHRMGSGIFEHIRKVKNLNYRTLNILNDPSKCLSAKDMLPLDLNILKSLLQKTNGFKDFINGDINEFICKPKHEENFYLQKILRFRARPTLAEITVMRAITGF
ncbi:MAG: glycosyltransferase family 61 protein [Campylobacteraceae bacterium]|nr:glycosyltransferase family 61 protein [Campylobacteraceae bacterium]